MVSPAVDLTQFVQRRELLAYEQRVARMAYAYGVDLRRASWLDQSTLGEPLMRGVDRRWNRLVESLSGEVLHRPDKAPPTAILEEVARIIRLLRAPRPTLRVLRAEAPRSDWPLVTPLGTTHGGAHWLVLDVPRLMALPEVQRSFLLAAGLGHLQCDHGPLFAAHLIAHRSGRGLGLVRTAMRPWTKVATFSADRAGLLAITNLQAAQDTVRAHADPGVPWYPVLPSVATRLAALQDFDRSRVMTRLRLLYASLPDRSQLSVASTAGPNRSTEDALDARRADQAQQDGHDDAEQGGEGKTPPAMKEALASAWSLARCDSRLTRRLGLL